jgi:methylaspartate mutase sigma subunit
MDDNNNEVDTGTQLETIAETPQKKLKVVLSTVSSDSHTWNLVFMQLLLEELGHEVINLGACVPDELIIEECARHKPDMLVISSVNGHGNIDGERLIRRMRADPSTASLPAVIGGKTGTKGADNLQYNQVLLEAGFSAVFEDAAGIEPFKNFLGMTAAKALSST